MSIVHGDLSATYVGCQGGCYEYLWRIWVSMFVLTLQAHELQWCHCVPEGKQHYKRRWYLLRVWRGVQQLNTSRLSYKSSHVFHSLSLYPPFPLLPSPSLPLLLPGYSWGSWEGNDWQNQWSKTTLLSKLFHFFLFTFPFCISFFDSSTSFVLPAHLPLPLSCWDQIILHGTLSRRQEGDWICKPLI